MPIDQPDEVLARFNLFDPDLPDVVDDVLAYAREHCPVAHTPEQSGYYLVSRYEDVRKVLLDDKSFSCAKGRSLPHRQPRPMPPIDSDPPLHAEFRRVLNKYFFPKPMLDRYEDGIRRSCVELIEGWLAAGTCDLVEDYAGPLSAAVLARVVLGVEELDEVHIAQKLVEAIAVSNAPEAWRDLETYVETMLARRAEIEDPPDDVLTALLTGTVDGRPLTHEECLGIVTVVVLGGLDTTKGAIGSLLHHVCLQPELEDRLRDPQWTQAALDEFLRLDSPVTALARCVTRPIELAGQALQPGDYVMTHYGSANRDAARFERPDELDFDRDAKHHLAFGVGIHRCLGANVARQVITIAVEELLARVRDLRLVESTDVRYSTGVAKHPISVPVTFETR